MLLTLSASSLRSMVTPPGGKARSKSAIDLLDLPAFTRESLGLHGLTLSTDLLTGVSRDFPGGASRAGRQGRLRLPAAGRSGPACRWPTPTSPRPPAPLTAPHVFSRPPSSSGATPPRSRSKRRTMTRASTWPSSASAWPWPRPRRSSSTSCSRPPPASPAKPDRVADLLKKTGGFRLGTYPDFGAAAADEDPTSYLRRLTPYASVVCASTISFLGPGREGPRHGLRRRGDARGLRPGASGRGDPERGL